MKKIFCLIALSMLLCRPDNIRGAMVPADRWVEIDLYWFNHDNIEQSVNEFWERMYPLFRDVEGWKGVILNVGWLMDYIVGWQGDPDQMIMLPKNMKKAFTFSERGLLTGTSEERMAMAKERYSNNILYTSIFYQPWTYRDLRKLVMLIKKVAISKYNLSDFKVGSLVIGWEKIYSGEVSAFTQKHPNMFLHGVFAEGVVNLEAVLNADPGKFAAYPQGIPDGTPFTVFFGRQWGLLAKAIGLDAILLRDSFLGSGVYSRKGPYGTSAPEDPKKVESWTRASCDLVKQTKMANPQCIVMGYSNAASGVADWRINCLDLETLAKEGNLDVWIDQTWAGAWNEVGQRPEEFWNFPNLGWTYQLAYLLVRAAVLAETNVRHYILTETFDAWESWDIIHNASDRLRWGIWAYSHAAVKTPKGLKVPRGSYISWSNQGKMLLSPEDVKFLAENSNEAFSDASQMKNIFGPTLVYSRSAMEWQSKNAPQLKIKEWIDEQAGTLMKWSVPIMSITRLEYLPQVESDMFIFQTPSHLLQGEKETILNLIRSDKPAAIFGSPAGGLDPEIAASIGVSTKENKITKTRFIGSINYRTAGIFENLQNTFPIYQPFTSNKFEEQLNVIYSVDGSPCLGMKLTGKRRNIFWDPPELRVNMPELDQNASTATDELIGSPIPWVLTARALNLMCKDSGLPYVDKIEQGNPVYLSSWQNKDGSYRILAGNLEEGVTHIADQSRKVEFIFPEGWSEKKLCDIAELWEKGRQVTDSHRISVFLDQAESKLYSIKGTALTK